MLATMEISPGVVPSLDERLGQALDFAGLTPSAYWRALSSAGVVCTRDYVYKMLSGDRPFPPYPVIAASAAATGVPVEWFFEVDVPAGGPSEFMRVRGYSSPGHQTD